VEGTSDDLNALVMLSIKVENFKKIEQALREEIVNTEYKSRVEIKDDYFANNKDDIKNEANPLK
jgi:hypothetical protein